MLSLTSHFKIICLCFVKHLCRWRWFARELFFARVEWKGWRLQLFPKTKETANLMKDKIQFDSKYNFDLPINHYMFFLPSQKKRSRRVRFEYNIIFCCHVCMHRTLLHLILRNIPQSSVLVIFFVVRSLSTSFIHPCYFSHSHPHSHTLNFPFFTFCFWDFNSTE